MWKRKFINLDFTIMHPFWLIVELSDFPKFLLVLLLVLMSEFFYDLKCSLSDIFMIIIQT